MGTWKECLFLEMVVCLNGGRAKARVIVSISALSTLHSGYVRFINCIIIIIIMSHTFCFSFSDGIAPLVKLLNSENGDVAENSSLALANLTSGTVQNCVELAERNGIEPLIGLLSSSREGAQANAAQVLTNMATDEILRADIQSRGVVGALLTPLHSRYNPLNYQTT